MAVIEIDFPSEAAAQQFLKGNLGASFKGGQITLVGAEDIFVGATKAARVSVSGNKLIFTPTAMGTPPDFKAALVKAQSAMPGVLPQEKLAVKFGGLGRLGGFAPFVQYTGFVGDVGRAVVAPDGLRREVERYAAEVRAQGVRSDIALFWFLTMKGVPHLFLAVSAELARDPALEC